MKYPTFISEGAEKRNSFVGLPGLDAFIQGKINQAVTEEREACANVCLDLAKRMYDHAKPPYHECAAAIRARSAIKREG